jgi:predicted Zn-dependent protease
MNKNRSRCLQSLLAAAVCILLGTGCETTPETGRRQLILLSSSDEMAMGFQSFSQMKKETPISKNAAASAMVQRVGRRIASVVDLPGAQWEFVLFESQEPNAFCLPGGKVGVYTGILALTKDDAGLAAVLGHEVAHAVLRHGNERVSRALAWQLGGSLLSTGLQVSSADPRAALAIQQAYGLGSQVGSELPHSRTQESEADHVGLRYMARAGYNPEAALAFWQRFAAFDAAQQASGKTPGFLRTHPTDETRIRQIQGWIPEAKAEYKPQP